MHCGMSLCRMTACALGFCFEVKLLPARLLPRVRVTQLGYMGLVPLPHSLIPSSWNHGSWEENSFILCMKNQQTTSPLTIGLDVMQSHPLHRTPFGQYMPGMNNVFFASNKHALCQYRSGPGSCLPQEANVSEDLMVHQALSCE